MKAAIIGNGGIAKEHRKGYSLLKEEGYDLELVAVCDVRKEMLTENDGARTYTDVDEMLKNEPDLDFVDICLPTYLHAEYSIKCMRAGLNVLCEKPMALTEEETQKMLECAKETGKKFMIAHSCRFGSYATVVHDFILEQKFGRPLNAMFTQIQSFPRNGYENWFADSDKSGGAMLDLQAHNIDLITWFFGMPKAVSTVASERSDFKGYSSISANFIFGDGLYAHTYCDWSVANEKYQGREFRINFENGYIYQSGMKKVLVAVDKDGNETDLKPFSTMSSSTKRNEIHYFAEAIKNKTLVRMCLPEESAKVVKIMRAQEKSANNDGMPVYL